MRARASARASGLALTSASKSFVFLSSLGRNHRPRIHLRKRSSTSPRERSSGTSDSGRSAFRFASWASTFAEPQ